MSTDNGYIFLSCAIGQSSVYLSYSRSDPYDIELCRIYDNELHQILKDIFEETPNDQLEKLIGIKNSQRNSLFQKIRRRSPDLHTFFENKIALPLLWIAVLCRFQNSAELLVNSGADVNEFCQIQRDLAVCADDNFDKLYLLHALIEMYPSTWNEQFISLVMQHGANNLTIRNLYGYTALHLAVKFSRVQLTKMLILERRADLDTICNCEKTPLFDAVESEDANELVPFLIEHGANINFRNKLGFNVLYYLASAPGEENLNLARILIDAGVSPREVKNTDQPIHVAVQKDRIEFVNFFLDHGADVNARGFCSETPLSYAINDCENPKMILILLKRGANIDLKNVNGETAAHMLGKSDKNTVQKIEILLSVGADMFAEDKNGRTAFRNIIKMKDNEVCVEQVLKNVALKKSCLQPSVECKDEMIVKTKYLKYWNIYQKLINEIDVIKSMELTDSCRYIDLLTKCHCKIAPLTRNCEFEKKIKEFTNNYSFTFSKDVSDAFNRAKIYYQSFLDQEEMINEAFDNTLPTVVVRRTARYIIMIYDICELKKIVQANRDIKS